MLLICSREVTFMYTKHGNYQTTLLATSTIGYHLDSSYFPTKCLNGKFCAKDVNIRLGTRLETRFYIRKIFSIYQMSLYQRNEGRDIDLWTQCELHNVSWTIKNRQIHNCVPIWKSIVDIWMDLAVFDIVTVSFSNTFICCYYSEGNNVW